MSIKVGKIRITEELCKSEGSLSFFKFKQNKIEYYCTAIQLLDEKEGYLAFNLPKKLDDLFRLNEYSPKAMFNLFNEEVEDFYFVSFEDENAESEVIEYLGNLSKQEVLNLYNI